MSRNLKKLSPDYATMFALLGMCVITPVPTAPTVFFTYPVAFSQFRLNSNKNFFFRPND